VLPLVVGGGDIGKEVREVHRGKKNLAEKSANTRGHNGEKEKHVEKARESRNGTVPSSAASKTGTLSRNLWQTKRTRGRSLNCKKKNTGGGLGPTRKGHGPPKNCPGGGKSVKNERGS